MPAHIAAVSRLSNGAGRDAHRGSISYDAQHPMTPSPTNARLVQSIVCPVDFSAPSRLALQAALAIARRFDAPITVLYVEDPLLSQAAKMTFDGPTLAKTADTELRRFVQRALGRDIVAPTITYRIVSGEPATEIRKATKRASADLIVIGTQGLSGTRKFMVGSITEAVLRETRVAVLAVPAGAARMVRAAGWPGKQVLAAVDLGAHAAADVRAAVAVATAFGASLLLAHVVRPLLTPPWLQTKRQHHDRSRLTEVRDRLLALAARHKRVKIDPRIVLGDPAEEIAALAALSNAGLAILILRRGGGLFGPRKGSITYRVLCSSATPVLAIPAPL